MSQSPWRLAAVLFSLWSCLLFATTALAQTEPATGAAAAERPEPKVIFFDVNETLLDLQDMRESVGKALNGQDELLPLWFSTMLHYSLVDSATDRYHDFGDIGVAALMMVARTNDIDLDETKARQAIVEPLRSLPPHADVEAGLKALKKAGYTLVTLTNSSNKGVKTQLENADLMQYFDRRLSIEDIERYKPFLRTYQWAAEQMGIEPEEGLLVAAHGWDIAGARAAGMPAVFVRRPGKTTYPLALPASGEIDGIDDLLGWLRPNDDTD